MLRCVALICAMTCFPALADVLVTDATVRVLPPGVPNTAAYFVISNQSDADIHLVGASSDAAKTLELHNHVMQGEVMRMERQDEVHVAAGQTLTFQPGGLHVMMFGITSPLSEGQNVQFTLHTKQGMDIDVSAKAVLPGQESHSHHGHH